MATSRASTTSNALTIRTDVEGNVQYEAIARQGHDAGRIIHASFKDLIPLRQRSNAGEVDLARPSPESVAETTERTKNALAKLVSGAVAAQKPKNVNVGGKRDPTFVRYTPANQMGDKSKKQERIMKIVERQQDPMEPPKFKHKKIPRGPPSPPPPAMHSPPRRLTAEEQEMWKIPPPVSNWKNPKGFTVPLDKRLAADGRGLTSITINDKFAQFSEALFMADRHAREEVRQRQLMQQRLAEKEKAAKEEELRALATKAREERLAASRGRRGDRSYSRSPRSDSGSGHHSRNWRRHDSSSRSRSCSRARSYGSASDDHSNSDGDSSVRARIAARRERQRSEERKLRQSRMGAERRMQVLAREQGRDISEKIALGIAKPTQSKEGMYDSRLFDRDSGMHAGFNEDNPYDKPLFQAQNALSSIYSHRAGGGGDYDDYEDEEAGDRQMDRIRKQGARFGDALGKGVFKGSETADKRDGPVQFEKSSDPFNVDKFFNELGKEQRSSGRVTGTLGGETGPGPGAGGGPGTGEKRGGYGLQSPERQGKRARVADDSDGD